MTRLGGMLIEYGSARYFVPVAQAQRVVRRSVISSVPGTRVGMTLYEGRVIPVLGLERAAGEDLLVCELRGELVAVGGLRVVRAGFFEQDAGGVRLDGQVVAPLDLSAEVEALERELWDRRHASGDGHE
jgi:hypothetical protein